MTQIYKKSLVLTKVEAGNIVNLASNDCQKIADAFTNLQYLWSAVLEVAGKNYIDYALKIETELKFLLRFF